MGGTVKVSPLLEENISKYENRISDIEKLKSNIMELQHNITKIHSLTDVLELTNLYNSFEMELSDIRGAIHEELSTGLLTEREFGIVYTELLEVESIRDMLL